MFFSSFFCAFQPAILAKPQNTRQRYYFFRTYASAMRIFFVIKSNFASFSLLLFPFVSRCMPPIYHLFATYLHRNLIGTSPNDEHIIKQLSPKYHLYLQLCLLSSGVPENARGVLGCLTNVIRVCRTASTKIVLQVAIFLHMS